MTDTITLPREVVEQLLKMLEMVEPYADQLTDYSSTAAECPLNLLPEKVGVAITALRAALAAEPTKPEPVAYFDLQKQVFYWARPTMIDVPKTIALEPLPLYTAPPDAPTVKESLTHPGYIIGSHWLETAYSRICAGEAEADVLRDIGLVREEAFLTGVAHLKAENEALRRDAERYRWGVENARWVRHEHEAYVAIPVAVDADLSCTPMRTAAIDAAMGDKT